MNSFLKKIKRPVKQTGLGALVEGLTDVARSSALIGDHGKQVTASVLSMEGLTDSGVAALGTAYDGLTAAIEGLISEMPADVAKGFTKHQQTAAAMAGLLAGDIRASLSAPTIFNAVATENMSVMPVANVADAFTKRSLAFEAYDESDNRNAVQYSIAYNMHAARQDEFGEAFFPTTVISPDQIGYQIGTRLIQVYNDLHRSITGALDPFNKKNVIRAVADATILKNDLTKITPVVRAGQSEANFVAAGTMAARNVVVDGETISTAPLLPGKRFSLLALSQTDSVIANGTFDSTDSIDPAISLAAVYMKVGADIVSFNVLHTPGAVFNGAVQGLQRNMTLAYRTESLLLTNANKNYDASAFAGALAGIVTSNLMVRVGLSATGSVNTELGDTEIHLVGLRCVSIQNSSGDFMDMTQAPALAVANGINGGSLIGYDLQAYRTNLNRRQRGQLLDVSYVSQLYAVPLRSPITVLRPVTADGSTDSSDLAGLINVTHARTSNAAVGALLTAAGILDDFTDSRDTSGIIPEVLGCGRHLVKPVFFRESLDMALSVDSIQSHERAADIQAVLMSKIRDLVYRMFRDSEYKAAADMVSGGQSKTPTVIIGTDPVIARYLMKDGDLRTIGSDFEVRVVSTLDTRMAGKVAVTFGDFSSGEGAPNPLHFGNMAWKPELTVVLPVSRGGQTSKELTVQPAFLHVVNLPILSLLTVTNIPDVVASKIAVFTKEQV